MKTRDEYLEILKHFARQQQRTVRKKQQFIQAYRKHNANIVRACKEADIKSTKTVYNWKATDSVFKEAVDLSVDLDGDMPMKSLIYELLFGEEFWATRYYLDGNHDDVGRIYRAFKSGEYASRPFPSFEEIEKREKRKEEKMEKVYQKILNGLDFDID